MLDPCSRSFTPGEINGAVTFDRIRRRACYMLVVLVLAFSKSTNRLKRISIPKVFCFGSWFHQCGKWLCFETCEKFNDKLVHVAEKVSSPVRSIIWCTGGIYCTIKIKQIKKISRVMLVILAFSELTERLRRVYLLSTPSTIKKKHWN